MAQASSSSRVESRRPHTNLAIPHTRTKLPRGGRGAFSTALSTESNTCRAWNLCKQGTPLVTTATCYTLQIPNYRYALRTAMQATSRRRRGAVLKILSFLLQTLFVKSVYKYCLYVLLINLQQFVPNFTTVSTVYRVSLLKMPHLVKSQLTK